MKPYWDNGTSTLYQADAREIPLPDGSVHCVVTSPPYWGLRDYGHWQMQQTWGNPFEPSHFPDSRRYRGERHLFWLRWRAGERGGVSCRFGCCWIGALGREPTIDLYIAHMVQVFREVRRVLRDDGTMWLNLGDAYANDAKWGGSTGGKHVKELHGQTGIGRAKTNTGLAAKDIIGIPGEVSRALRMPHLRCRGCDQVAHLTAWGYWPDRTPICPGCWKSEGQLVETPGWIVRSPIVWHKLNPMPENVTDRPTSAYEMLFLISKQGRYFYDAEAGKEPSESGPSDTRKMAEGRERIGSKYKDLVDPLSKASSATNIGRRRSVGSPSGRNARNVWTFATQPRSGKHFATFPDELPRRCILAGTSEHGVCGECGAQWARVVASNGGGNKGCNASIPPGAKNPGAYAKLGGGTYYASRTTLGWRPTCDHDADTEPATVLDPFVGSGTTVAVAQALGRRGVGLDLNSEYLDIATRRIIKVPLPMRL